MRRNEKVALVSFVITECSSTIRTTRTMTMTMTVMKKEMRMPMLTTMMTTTTQDRIHPVTQVNTCHKWAKRIAILHKTQSMWDMWDDMVLHNLIILPLRHAEVDELPLWALLPLLQWWYTHTFCRQPPQTSCCLFQFQELQTQSLDIAEQYW